MQYGSCNDDNYNSAGRVGIVQMNRKRGWLGKIGEVSEEVG